MAILIACEESQTVCKAFREHGAEAYSCDILPCSGGQPNWHIHEYLEEVIGEKWDAIIAFPPCTYLATCGNWTYSEKYKDRFPGRIEKRQYAINFFMMIANNRSNFIAIENPVGIMSTQYRKPDQIIQPYMFGHPAQKTTCLWLKNLPPLQPTIIVEPEFITYNGKKYPKWMYKDLDGLTKKERQFQRSKTFSGIAQAMAKQWIPVINSKN